MAKNKQRPKTLPELIDHEQKYVFFLRTRLDSENYKASATPEEYESTKQKYDKAKFRLKTLKEQINPKR